MTTPENTLRVGFADQGPSFRGALASRDFSLLFVGQVTAAVGNGVLQLALPWLVLDLTGSALQLGVAYFFQFLPMLLFGIAGGVFVDRFDRRLTIIVADGVRAVAFLSVGMIYYLDALTVQHIYAVIFLESTMANFFNPARAALMPNLVKNGDLRAANSLMEISRHIGFIVAPPAGGVLIALIGASALFLMDGVTFAISAITVFLIAWRPPQRVKEQSESWRHSVQIVLQETKAGLAVIGHQQLLQVAVLLGLSLNVIIAPIQVLMPLFVRDVKHAGASYFGLLVAGLLVGLILGSLIAPAGSRRLGLGRMTIIAVIVLGIVVAVASWPPSLWPPVVAMMIAGTCIGSLNVAQATMLQDATSDDERGRVSATYFTSTLGIRPLSFLAMGALASAVDIRLLFTALGVFAVALGAMLYRIPKVRDHH
jgi:MFS family permease